MNKEDILPNSIKFKWYFGATDEDLAKHFNMSLEEIKAWREERGLEANTNKC